MMIRVALAVLIAGMLCNSALSMAEDPVPFKTLMQTAGAQPALPPNSDAKDKSVTASTPPAHRSMTRGGKIMSGVGIGMIVVGATGIVGTAAWRGPATPSDKDKLYAASGGTAGLGVVLIILGHHRQTIR